VLYMALFVAALAVISVAVYAATTRNVEHMVRDQLAVSGTVFDNLAATRYRKLQDEAQVLSHDFGFRAAVATGDQTTVRSALDNLAERLGVNLAFVVTPDGQVTRQTGAAGTLPADVVQAVLSDNAASGIFVENGLAYEAVAAPILTPAPAGWVVFANPLGSDAMSALSRLSAIPLRAAVMQRRADGAWVSLSHDRAVVAGPKVQALITEAIAHPKALPSKLTGAGGVSAALVRVLPSLSGGQGLVLLLQCPLTDALKPFASLTLTITGIGVFGVLVLVVGSWFLALTLTKPISALEDAAKRLQKGERARVTLTSQDEIARLGLSFNAMADEIEAREDGLIKARDVAEAANLAKNTFLANMNHEVRTPLNGVVGVAGMLGATNLDARQKEMVDLIEASGASLARILNDVLDMVDLGAGQMTVVDKPFDLRAAIHRMAEAATVEAQAKGLQFRLAMDDEAVLWRRGDERRMAQVLSNLLSNAVKFTDAGHVALTVGKTEDTDLWSFEVRDTGVGFEPANVEAMFEPFRQVDGTTTRRFGGTGLGLSLARQMARAMGGDVTGDAEPGRGAVFVLTLPLQPAEAPAAVEIASVQPEVVEEADADADMDMPPIRILLADDHPANRQVVALILGSLGVDLVSVENGAEAVEAFKQGPFDVVLMDLQMPVMDGLTAIRLIRAHEAAQGMLRTPVLVISANIQADHLKASAEAGADSHLAKPILAPTLISALEEALLQPGGEASCQQSSGYAVA